ncbi:hypothetical protein EGJ50_19390 [Pseudomonas luteola]|jgi:hypothetical protein|nr:hypothetical protein EGJ50_19390 [Pseudomonas luteola]
MPLRRHIERLVQVFDHTYEIKAQSVSDDKTLLSVRTQSGEMLLTRSLKPSHIANSALLDLIIGDCERELRQHETGQDAAAVKAGIRNLLKESNS